MQNEQTLTLLVKDLEAITQNIGWLGATMSFAYCSAPLASIQEVTFSSQTPCCFILEKVKCSTFPKENIRGSTSGQSVADPNGHKLVSSISFSFTVFLQVCRNRSTRSLPFYLILSTCIVTGLWSIYGIVWIDAYQYIGLPSVFNI